VRRCLVLLTIAAGLATATAAGAPGDPQRQFTAADQAKARTIALRASDLPGSGWKGTRSSGGGGGLTCAGFRPDQSDLVETGRAESLDFERANIAFASSVTGIFRTKAMADAAFARVTGAGLVKCMRSVFTESLGSTPGVRVVGSREQRSPVPRVAPRSRAYRLGVTLEAAGQRVQAVLDTIVLGSGRANTAVLVVAVGEAFSGPALASLSRRVAARMAMS
jgi:hypothetical protein